MNPVVTQKCARHRSFKSTSCYININPKDCIDALDKTFGSKEKKEELQQDMQELVNLTSDHDFFWDGIDDSGLKLDFKY